MILAIESSCDETSLAIIENGKILRHSTFDQIELHSKYGGIVPELASRQHMHSFLPVIIKVLLGIDKSKIKYIAYTNEPGLIGPLQIGELTAKGLALALSAKLVPINHIHGHIYSAAIDNEITYPSIALIVSGGHTQLQLLEKPYTFKILGQTLDDAAGETFDKIGKKLDLPYPGGKYVEELARNSKNEIKFSIPMKNTKDLNFSFSGLKSQAINYINKNTSKLNAAFKSNIAKGFQNAIINELILKTKMAIKKYSPKSIILCGGVSSNLILRNKFKQLHSNYIIPKTEYCTDNSAMIAKAAEVKINNSNN